MIIPFEITEDFPIAQNEFLLDGEFYFGILLGIFITFFLGYLILNRNKLNSDNKLTI